jgi:4-nitrophenyl phosphatase
LNRRDGARFVATNADRALPVENGFWPGAGAIVAAVQTATSVQPFIVGKPAPTLLRAAMKRIQADLATTAMVGDQIASDIKAGIAAGVRTILVGTDPIGDDDQDENQREPEAKPDVQVADLYELVDILRRGR